MHPFCYKSIYATSKVKYRFNTDFTFHYCLSAFCVLKSAWHLCSNNYIAVLYKWLFIVRTLQFSIYYCMTCYSLLSSLFITFVVMLLGCLSSLFSMFILFLVVIVVMSSSPDSVYKGPIGVDCGTMSILRIMFSCIWFVVLFSFLFSFHDSPPYVIIGCIQVSISFHAVSICRLLKCWLPRIVRMVW